MSKNILDVIFTHKALEVARLRQEKPLEALVDEVQAAQPPPMDFAACLRASRRRNGSPALIAEIKRASPSKGLFAAGLDAVAQARLYRDNGAAAISILTDEHYFHGSLGDLASVGRDQAELPDRLPLLRKDFILDPYQVYAARAAGADAILLILAWLADDLSSSLYRQALELGMTPLVEVHQEDELERALRLGAKMIGINNRDLRTFNVSLEVSKSLSRRVPDDVCLVSESGIFSHSDALELAEYGVDAILVGESIVTAKDPAVQVRSLSGVGARQSMRERR